MTAALIALPVPTRIEITKALVRETFHHTVQGISSTRHDPPAVVFNLEYVDSHGREIVWDGSSHADALAAAREWAAEGVVVRDLTAAS